MTELRGKALLDRIRGDFIGLDTEYPLATGGQSRRIYLDSTASTLMMGPAYRVMQRFLHHYANTHSTAHTSALLATRAYCWAHDRILKFAGADNGEYACIFVGSGTTHGVNRMAQALTELRPERDTAVLSIMEHHSNDLPHRKHLARVIHAPVTDTGSGPGAIDLDRLAEIFDREGERINYLAVTGVSNVTGIINPVAEMARLAHRYGAYILVDGAQMAAHLPMDVAGSGAPDTYLDVLIFSGHKTYVPGSPGVVIVRKELLADREPVEVGGGIVERVFTDRLTYLDSFPDREEAGTPNIPGAIGLAAAVEVLDRIGMDFLLADEQELVNHALASLAALDDVTVYGCLDTAACPRVASVVFNIAGLPHALVAALLNDYHNIAVRNECFCAHPYVMSLMPEESAPYQNMSDEEWLAMNGPKPGMVRASFGIYNTRADVDALTAAVQDIRDRSEFYLQQYELGAGQRYYHKQFRVEPDDYFSISQSVTAEIDQG